MVRSIGVLLEGVGRPKIVEGKLISAKSFATLVAAGLQRATERKFTNANEDQLNAAVPAEVSDRDGDHRALRYAGYLYVPVAYTRTRSKI
jgi:hypothetical protein